MNLAGRKFLSDACAPAQEWAEQFPDLEIAWYACQRGSRLLWAIKKLRRRGEAGDIQFIPNHWTAADIRAVVENPFAVSRRWCLFCVPPRRLTPDEDRDSNLVGTLPRCRDHLAHVAPELGSSSLITYHLSLSVNVR